MPNAHLRSLLIRARSQVQAGGVIAFDTAVALMSLGCDVTTIERNFRKEHGFD
jgi:pyruvate/2-oxoglutarate dehydrogenase complex dihydrolipoamide dehydrogenase (E3) component